MSALRFVHLRVHSEYSVSDSIVRLDALIGAALSATAGPLFGFGSGALTLMQQVKLFAGCGGAAALMSALACLRFRPRSSPAEDGAQV